MERRGRGLIGFRSGWRIMRTDCLWQMFGSDPDVALFVGHTAFQYPISPLDAPLRESQNSYSLLVLVSGVT